LSWPPVSEVFVARSSSWPIAFPAAWAIPAVIRLAARIRLAENSLVLVLIEVPLDFLVVDKGTLECVTTLKSPVVGVKRGEIRYEIVDASRY
jgi:hypothetical protein